MKRLFGTAKAREPAAPPPSLSECSGKMDSRIAGIEEKIRKCEEDLRRYMSQGRSQQQRQMALQVMKRKKMYEQQRDQIMGTQFNIDSLAFAQEQAEVTAMSVTAMKAGHQELKASYANMNIGDIEKLMDEMADFADESKEINEAISQSFAVPDGFDEADCEAEFAALEEEMKMESLVGLTPARPAYLDTPAASAPPAPMPAVPEATTPAAAVPAGAAVDADTAAAAALLRS